LAATHDCLFSFIYSDHFHWATMISCSIGEPMLARIGMAVGHGAMLP
jgi:hypothetical protein